MTTFIVIYALGFLFHAYCAYVEIRHFDRQGTHLDLYAHVRATSMLIVWPIVPLTILFNYYYETLSDYAEPQSPNR